MRDSVRGPHGRSGVRGKFLSRGHCSGHRGAERELSLGGKKGAEEVSTGGLQGDGGGCFGEVCVCVCARRSNLLVRKATPPAAASDAFSGN